MNRLAVFGYGGTWKIIKKSIDFSKCEIVNFVNSDENETGKIVENVEVIHHSKLEEIEFDYLILASENIDKQNEILKEINISQDKIISPYFSKSGFFKRIHNRTNDEIKKYTGNQKFKELQLYETEMHYLVSMDYIGRKRRVDINEYQSDYVRISTLELLASEINSKNLVGSVAEVGVFKGEFVKILNALFKERKLYLFDTFEGFMESDIHLEIQRHFSNPSKDFFKETSVEQVLSRMPFKEKVVIKKGYFPDSLENLDDQFVFVSLDTDLYKPILEGLEYFYPRLVKNGYILVHDYNNVIYSGVKFAVDEFVQKYDISVIPVSDRMGSVIITK